MLTVFIKRDSYRQVVTQIGEMVARSISEIDMEQVKKLTLNPQNPTHAHYVQQMPVIFMIDRLRGQFFAWAETDLSLLIFIIFISLIVL